MAAADPGRFWEMYAQLYANQWNLERPALIQYAELAGLDVARFESDINSRVFEDAVRADVDQAHSTGIRGVPSVLINDQRITGVRDISEYRAAIESVLKSKMAAK
jgi:predicted DsbA family dithiol-disulfide isomerase